jgi:hypothetical protein
MARKRTFQTIWIILLLISHLILSYNYHSGWWLSAVGFVVILVFSYLIWGKDFILISGLKINRNNFLETIVMAFLVTGYSVWFIHWIGSKHHVVLEISGIKSYVNDVFYILNEEIVLGAMALFVTINHLKIRPWVASMVLAALVSIAHLVCYKWYFTDKGILQISTLLTLFFIAFVKNNLIIRYKHIGYSWAIHFGWMVVMFGSNHYDIYTHMRITDFERFNMYLGSYEMLFVSIVLAGVSGAVMFLPQSRILSGRRREEITLGQE